MAHAKLHINLTQGLVEVEGDEEFVTKIYHDFKELVAKKTITPLPEKLDVEVEELAAPERSAPRQRKSRRKSPRSSGNGETRATKYSPKLDKNLDLSQLQEFVGQYDLTTAQQKILLYAHFLKEVLGIDPCTKDQVFSCMKEMGDRIPEAFGQAFVDCRKKGLIDFSGHDDIVIPIVGQNFIKFKMPKAKAAG